ncbi:MAG: LysM peptidoglycan-binding domain-containing protein [Firmicutes bacterium]|nr:LysM peptidoglycan-binding domain-containing protein [Bacillota bacterium]
MRGYRISSRPRFIAFVTICIILFTLCFNLIFALSTAQSESVENYIKVGVSSGDTLWSIAQTYMPDTDTREAVYIIKKINNLDSDYLTVGTLLDIPA